MKTPLICRMGYHSFRITHTSPIRDIYRGAHSPYLYEMVEKCVRCPCTRTTHFAKLPRKVKA